MMKKIGYVLSTALLLLSQTTYASEPKAKLKQAEILKIFSGRKVTITVSKKQSWSTTFAKDGTLLYPSGKKGLWSVKSDKICDHPETLPEVCNNVYRLEKNKVLLLKDGETRGVEITY